MDYFLTLNWTSLVCIFITSQYKGLLNLFLNRPNFFPSDSIIEKAYSMRFKKPLKEYNFTYHLFLSYSLEKKKTRNGFSREMDKQYRTIIITFYTKL